MARIWSDGTRSAEADFEVNQKAEKGVEVILLHLEHQAAEIERQGELILEILKRLAPQETATDGKAQS